VRSARNLGILAFMAEWLILLLLVPAIVVPVVMLVGFAGCPRDLEDFTTAPRFPDPVIDSAVGTSACCITLNWISDNSGVENFEIERDGVPLPDKQDSTPFKDCGLLANTSYTYRVRAWTVDGPHNWSAEVVGTTLPFVPTFQGWPDKPYTPLDSDGWEGFTLVQRIEPLRLSSSGTQVRITLRASSVSDASIDRIYISRPQPNPTADPAIHPYDSFGDLTPITTTKILIPQGQSITISDVNVTGIDYTLENGLPLIIAVDFTNSPPSGVAYIETVSEEAAAYWKFGVAEAGQNVRGPDYQVEPRIYLIEKIEVG
jgi:hypothetical protein